MNVFPKLTISGYKTSLNKYRNIGITACILFHHNGIRTNNTPQKCKWKELIKIKDEINKIEMKQQCKER